jgi:hypothetical protein
MPKPDLSIDEPSYQEGRAAFAAGATLRDIVKMIDVEGLQALEQRKVISSTLGLFDALLDHLRGINTPSKAL